MNEGKLQQVLFQIQEQNKELLTMVMNLEVSNNQLKEQLGHDFYKVYQELYNPKEGEDMQEFLQSKRFILDELNDITNKETDKTIRKFEENFAVMEENLENIFL